MKIAVVNTKGGVGKTTTAVYVASALHAAGGPVIAIDADRQQSMTVWGAHEPGLPFPVVAHQQPHRIAGDLMSGRGGHLVIDTPPGDEAVIESAVRAVDIVIIPVGASGLDVDRLRPTWDLLAKIEDFHEFVGGVLLTKVRRRTRALAAARDVLGSRYPVLETEIPLREEYAAAFGTYPGDQLGAYDDLLREIKS